MKKLQDSLELKKSSLEKKAKMLATLKEDVQKQRGMLKDEALNEKIKEAQNLEYDLKHEEQKAKESLQAEQQEMFQGLQAEIVKVIKKLRDERGYTFVFNSQALMSADDMLDITDEVIKAVDAQGGLPGAPPKKPAATAPTGPAKPKPAAR
jgi:outer membrane protein